VIAVSGATSPAAVSPVTPGTTTGTTAASLLPDAQPLSSATLNNAMSGLYVVLSQSRQNSLRSSDQRVEENQTLRDKALADAKAAIERQVEAQKTGSFWHDLENGAMWVAKVALAVVAVAATVVTAGAASPVLIAVALAFTAGGMVVSETKCFGDKASQWVGLGMEVVGAVLSCGAGLTTAGATAGSQLLATTGNVATVAGTSAAVVGGAAHIEGGVAAADSERAAADIEQSTQDVDRLNRLVAWVIDSAKEGDKSKERSQESLRAAMETNDQTATAVVPMTTMKG
jgi:hypothetical protein